ncbi:MAG: lysylphosphatidylglycerol synthase transmembrane domain-containing protein [Jiangellales bacterium]
MADSEQESLWVTVHRRTTDDLKRLGWFLALLLVGVALATGLDETMAGIESDIVEGFVRVPATVAGLVVSIVSVLFLLLAIGAPILLLVARRFRTFAVGGLGIVLAAVAFVVVRDAVPVRILSLPDGTETAFAAQGGWPSGGALAVYTAAAVIAGIELPRRWRHAVWVMLGVLATLRILTSADLPLDVLLAIGVGGVVGASLLLVFGRTARVASAAGVRDALERSGLSVSEVQPLSLERSSWEFRARTDVGPVRAKVVGRESQQIDSLYRAYRRVRLRDVGDDTAYSSARRAVAVEALLTVYSADRGVRSPDVRAITPLHGDHVVLAVDEVEGTSLAELDDAALSDDVLRQCWAQVAGLRAARVAHRDLELGNLVLDPAGQVWLVDYSFGQAAADDQVMAGDIAELLAATYVRVGAQRSVAAAAEVLGTEPLADAMTRLVPAALTSQTRKQLKDVEDAAQPLIDELSRVTGVDEPQLAKVERLKPQYLVMAALLAVAVYVLIPQLADFPRMLEAIREADWRYVPPALLASVLTYIAVAMSMSGATPGRVSVPEYGGLAMSSAFVASFAPPGIGHLGLNLRYLQKRGFSPPVSVSVIASKEAATFISHLVLLLVVGLWAGRSGALEEELERLPPAGVMLAVGGGILVVVGLSLFVPRVQTLVRETVVPAVKHSIDAMGQVARDPVKITLLFTGVTLLSVAYSACLYFSVTAFGSEASFAAIALIYLTAGSVAAAAPTPGGLGAVEAILIAALTGIGIASPIAVAGVFLYRFATFWLPILPGLLAFRWLTARGAV